MLQALLEDRFKLRVHRETREVSVYALTVAKGGPKLQPFKEDSCIPYDSMRPPAQDQKVPKFCGAVFTVPRAQGTNRAVEGLGSSLDEFSKMLGGFLDRPVISKTRISGVFDFHLEYATDDGPGAAPLDGPSIFTAIQEQLGLKLEPTKGPDEFLVIDHVERPSAN